MNDDDVKLLLSSGVEEATTRAQDDLELIRIGGSLIRLKQHPGWPVLVRMIFDLRNDLASQVLSDEKLSVDYIRGQADGAKKVVALVENAIQAAQEAAGRMEQGQKVRKGRDYVGGDSGLVDES